jgi:uncharacterized protein
MKKEPVGFGKFVFFVVATLLLISSVFGQQDQPFSINNSPLPPANGFVNDYAGVIDTATKQQLETKLQNFKDTTNPSVEIAVAVVKTTGERDIFDYSLATARGWKIGSKDDDNPSALLFIAVDDRKYFTQVSRDLEDELPDGVVGSLQRQYLVPEFKKGNYSKGISDTVDAYIATIRNKGNAATAPQKPVTGIGTTAGGGGAMFGLFCCGAVVLFIVLIAFGRSRGGPTKGDRNRWGGGGFGSGGGDIASNIASGILGGIIGSSLSGGSSSSSSNWGGSSGGGWGGFGGGGDFGGGGAGGSW